jgi:rhamnose utilization protein RhaD (predicted bifunctional aldolase and dehydrogenase)
MNKAYQAIRRLCEELSNDRLLVQGAGGNISWKEGGTLWIKGSGTWLANAGEEDIFVPVNLNHLRHALSQKNFEIKPQLLVTRVEKKLRPSIETILHALMPQKIVVHLHAIDVLSYLVSKDCLISLKQLFALSVNTHQVNGLFVDYHKPGPKLAQAIHKELQSNTTANVVFLKNHGIVIGAESIEAIYAILKSINTNCSPKQKLLNTSHALSLQASAHPEYIIFPNKQVQALATNHELYKRLQSDWVLFPDHAVFLGPKAFTYPSWANLKGQEENNANKPELIFIENTGVFVKPNFNQAQTAQLLCYYDVISRILPDAELDPLDESSINDLLNWDAEKLRQRMSK